MDLPESSMLATHLQPRLMQEVHFLNAVDAALGKKLRVFGIIFLCFIYCRLAMLAVTCSI